MNFIPISMVEIVTDRVCRDYNQSAQSRTKVRPDGRIHGGVTIYIAKELTAERLKNVSVSLPHIESLFLRIKLNKSKNLNIGAIYRPPNADPIML